MAARHQLSGEDLVAAPILDLVHATGETVTFSLASFPWRVCVYVVEGPSDLRQVAKVGERYPLYLGAAGRAILAFLSDEVVRATIDGHPEIEADRADILRQLESIRSTGYAIVVNEWVKGAAALAAPVFVAGQIYGSVALTGPAGTVTLELDRYIPLLLDTASTLSARLSHGPALMATAIQ